MDDDDKVMAVLDIKGDDGVDEGEVADNRSLVEHDFRYSSVQNNLNSNTI